METLFDIPTVAPVALPTEPVTRYSYSLEHFHKLLEKHRIPLAEAMHHPATRAFLATRQGVLEGKVPLSVYTEQHECDCEHCRHEDTTISWHCPVCGLENEEHEALVEDFTSECAEERCRVPRKGGCGAQFEARLVDGKPRLFLVHNPERPTPRI